MADVIKKKLRRVTIIYWVLLLYIIVALVWWFLVLEKQNYEIHTLKKAAIEHLRANPGQYRQEVFLIEDQQRRKTARHVGEGVTFLLLIIVGAVFIYRAVHRQFRLQQQQQNFIMAITHELKTPIAVSRLNLETLQKYQLSEEKKHRLMQMTLQETYRLDTLINNILLSSQLEGHSYRVTKEPVDFSELAGDVVYQFSARYPDRVVHTNIEDGIELEGDPLLLKLLVSNLLENAHKYSPREQPVAVRLHGAGKKNVLEVADAGSGIADREKKKVFQKFYRIGNEQTRKAKGTGLGLYLCKKIAADHNASIHVADNKPQGSIFIVQFPKQT